MPTLHERKLLPLALLLLSLVMAACAGASTADDSSHDPLPGEVKVAEAVVTETIPAETAYPFTLPSGTGGDVSLASFAGERNLVLIFYRGFWRVYCREQLVELREDYEAIRGLGAEVLAVSTDDLRGAEQAVERLDVGFPILFDPDAEVVRRYGVYDLLRDRLATPSVFIIDKGGNVRWKYIGRNYRDRPSNRQIIAQLEALQ